MRLSASTAAIWAIAGAILLALALAAPAGARVRTLHLRYGPISMQPAELKAHNTPVPPPGVNGFITRMHAYVVDERGRPLPSNELMLHHAVFRKYITPFWDADCHARRDSAPFYATGEEVEVAAMAMRLSARIGAVAPLLAGDVSRRAGAGEVRKQMIAARRKGP
jgi:hypothetical protein